MSLYNLFWSVPLFYLGVFLMWVGLEKLKFRGFMSLFVVINGYVLLSIMLIISVKALIDLL